MKNIKRIFIIFNIILLLFFYNINYIYAKIDTPEKSDCPPSYVGQKKCFYVENKNIKNAEKKTVVEKRNVRKKNLPNSPKPNALPSYWGIMASGITQLLLMTDKGQSIYDRGTTMIEHFDQWAYDQIVDYSPLAQDGFNYVTEEMTNYFNNILNDFTEYRPDIFVFESIDRYLPLENYNSNIMTTFNNWMNDKDREIAIKYQIGPLLDGTSGVNRYKTFIVNQTASQASRGVSTLYGPSFRISTDSYIADSGLHNQSDNAINNRLNNAISTHENLLESWKINIDRDLYEKNNYILLENDLSLQNLTEKPQYFPDVEAVPSDIGISEIDGDLYFDISYDNPYYDSQIDIDPYLNPDKFNYYQKIDAPYQDPIPEYMPYPDTDTYPNPDPEKDPTPNPDPTDPKPDPEIEIPPAPVEPDGPTCGALDVEFKSIDTFKNKFPFSIPWDIYNAFYAVFGGMSDTDNLSFNYKLLDEDIEITIPDFILNAKPFINAFILILFDIGIIYALYRWFGGAS